MEKGNKKMELNRGKKVMTPYGEMVIEIFCKGWVLCLKDDIPWGFKQSEIKLIEPNDVEFTNHIDIPEKKK